MRKQDFFHLEIDKYKYIFRTEYQQDNDRFNHNFLFQQISWRYDVSVYSADLCCTYTCITTRVPPEWVCSGCSNPPFWVKHGYRGVQNKHPLWIRKAFFFFSCLLVTEVGDVRAYPYFVSGKLTIKYLQRGKKNIGFPPPPPPHLTSTITRGLIFCRAHRGGGRPRDPNCVCPSSFLYPPPGRNSSLEIDQLKYFFQLDISIWTVIWNVFQLGNRNKFQLRNGKIFPVANWTQIVPVANWTNWIQMVPVANWTQMVPVANWTQVVPVANWTQMVPVANWTNWIQMVPVANWTQMVPVANWTQMVPVANWTQMVPVANWTQVVPVANWTSINWIQMVPVAKWTSINWIQMVPVAKWTSMNWIQMVPVAKWTSINWIQMVPVAKWTSTGFKWFQLPDGPQSTGFKWFQLLINGPQSTGFKWFQLPNGPQINWTKFIPVAYGLKWTPSQFGWNSCNSLNPIRTWWNI